MARAMPAAGEVGAAEPVVRPLVQLEGCAVEAARAMAAVVRVVEVVKVVKVE